MMRLEEEVPIRDPVTFSTTGGRVSAALASVRGAEAGLDEPVAHVEALTSPRRVLVVDDSRLTRRYVEKVLLERGVCETVDRVESARGAMRVIADHPIDLVLCDLNMPGLNGLDFLRLLNGEPGGGAIPVIMLTGESGLEAKVRCLESGASDYLVKPFADEELVARARVHLELKELQDELRAKNEQLRKQACLDGLTGVSNRHHFLARLEHELGRAFREGLPLSLCMIDIDHFKRVNDESGHLCGDRALARVAALLEESVRDYDLLGRYGGEEFCAVFVNTDAERALRIAERCRRRVAAGAFVFDGREVRLTVSGGVVSTRSPEPGMSTELIARADEALYRAKRQGRDRTELAPEPGSMAVRE